MNNRGWREIKIGELGRVVTGKTPPTASPELFGDEYPFITPSDIDGVNRTVTTERYVSSAGAKAFKNQLIPRGAVCFVCIGATIGKMCVATRTSLTNQQINSVVVDESNHDTRFAYYALKEIAPNVKGLAGGAATPIINKGVFSEIPIRVPTLHVQRRIASILSAYDDLIENNTRRITILEEMTRRIYEEWFVRFRFPGHEQVKMVDSELGLIPEGWSIQTVEQTFQILGGGTPSKAEPSYWEGGTINWYSPTDLTKAGTSFMDKSSDRITELGLAKSSARLFPAWSVMMTSRATIGVVAVNTSEACTNQGFITCLPNATFPLWLLFHWLKANVETFIGLGTGATFKEITKGTFKGIKLIVPASEAAEQFSSLIDPMMKLCLNLQRKNRNLSATRDYLLPKLISGEIDVSQLAA